MLTVDRGNNPELAAVSRSCKPPLQVTEDVSATDSARVVEGGWERGRDREGNGGGGEEKKNSDNNRPFTSRHCDIIT